MVETVVGSPIGRTPIVAEKCKVSKTLNVVVSANEYSPRAKRNRTRWEDGLLGPPVCHGTPDFPRGRRVETVPKRCMRSRARGHKLIAGCHHRTWSWKY